MTPIYITVILKSSSPLYIAKNVNITPIEWEATFIQYASAKHRNQKMTETLNQCITILHQANENHAQNLEIFSRYQTSIISILFLKFSFLTSEDAIAFTQFLKKEDFLYRY